MAEVRIPVERFTTRTFPTVCAVSGLPAAELFAFSFGGVVGALPIHGRIARSAHRQQMAIKLLSAVVLLGFLLAVAFRSPSLGVATSAIAVVTLTNLVMIRRRLPNGVVDGHELKLTNVHSAFVDALDGSGAHKCSGCPSVGSCETEKVDACAGLAETASTAPTSAVTR